MLTNAATHAEHIRRSAAPPAQKVVIVNGNAAILNVLETVLDAGHYDVVFVEPTAHAYSQIKRVQPNLVILCINLDDLGGTHVLSMLKLAMVFETFDDEDAAVRRYSARAHGTQATR